MKTENARLGVATWAGLFAVFGLSLLLVSGAPAAEVTRVQINECVAALTISQTPPMPMVNDQVDVVLALTATNAKDGASNSINQIYDFVDYKGDCQTPPGLPCTPNMPVGFTYSAITGGTCAALGTTVTPGVMNMSVPPNGIVRFDFVPDLALLDGTSCTIEFRVSYQVAATIAAQANTTARCQGGAFNSDQTITTVQTIVPGVPTLGEIGLAFLALALMVGGWIVLRRRNAASLIGP